MNTKKIYLIRHGQTEYNKMGIVQGSGIDAPLNDLGRQQAAAFYAAHKHLSFEKIYTSSLIRTQQSVQKFIDQGTPHAQMPELNEIHWGEKEGKPFSPDDQESYDELTQSWQAGKTHRAIAGGESPEEVWSRQQGALKKILDQKSEQMILIAMHGRAMRIFLCLMLNYPLKYMDSFDHANLCLYELTYTGSSFRLDKANCQKHLQG